MSKKRIRYSRLGETRRQKNTRLIAGIITAALLIAVMIVSAVFLAWMLDDPSVHVLPKDTETASVTFADAEDETTAGAEPYAPETALPAPGTIMPSGTPYKVLEYTEKWVVMLDAGHGFDDIGTTSSLLGDVNEATVNLDIVLRLQELLADAGITVLLTHGTNAVDGRVSVSEGGTMPKKDLVLLTPEDRAALANGQDIDMYISVHCDSIPDKPEVSGMRMYYCNTENETLTAQRNAAAEALSTQIADAFYSEMGEGSVLPRVKALREDVAYYVIRAVTVPSVLCEVGFVTNKTDADHMLSPDWRQKAAAGIADGILAYIDAVE